MLLLLLLLLAEIGEGDFFGFSGSDLGLLGEEGKLEDAGVASSLRSRSRFSSVRCEVSDMDTDTESLRSSPTLMSSSSESEPAEE